MLNNNPNERPNCTQILAENFWCITTRDINYYGLNKGDFKQDYQDNFFNNYFKEKLRSFKLFDKRFKLLENIKKGSIESVFKVVNKSDNRVFTFKKIPYGMLI